MFVSPQYTYKGNVYRLICCQEKIEEEDLSKYLDRPRWVLDPTQRSYNILWSIYIDRVIGSWRWINFILSSIICLLLLLFITYITSVILPEISDLVSITLMSVLLFFLLLLFLISASVILITEKLLFVTDKYSIQEKKDYYLVVPHESSIITLVDGEKTTHWLY